MTQNPPQQWNHLQRQGFSRNELQRRLRTNQLRRIRRGVFTTLTPLSRDAAHIEMIQATLPLLSVDAVVSHQSAAVIHGLPLRSEPLNQVHVTRLAGSHGRSQGCLVIHRAELLPDELTTIDGIPVTSLARTASDLARASGYEWGVIAMDAALRLGATREELATSVEFCNRMWGIRRARSALEFADGRSESPLESISRIQFSRMGIPMPELQFEIRTPNGTFVARGDFGWRAERLVGEADGKVKYGDLLRPGQTAADAVMAEKSREQSIRNQGYWVVRWGNHEAWDLPVLTSLIRNAFRHAA